MKKILISLIFIIFTTITYGKNKDLYYNLDFLLSSEYIKNGFNYYENEPFLGFDSKFHFKDYSEWKFRVLYTAPFKSRSFTSKFDKIDLTLFYDETVENVKYNFGYTWSHFNEGVLNKQRELFLNLKKLDIELEPHVDILMDLDSRDNEFGNLYFSVGITRYLYFAEKEIKFYPKIAFANYEKGSYGLDESYFGISDMNITMNYDFTHENLKWTPEFFIMYPFEEKINRDFEFVFQIKVQLYNLDKK